jgi:hypothetical protein
VSALFGSVRAAVEAAGLAPRPGRRATGVRRWDLGTIAEAMRAHAGRTGQAPRRSDWQHAGKRRSGKTRKGDRWLRTALIEAAQSAAGRTKDTYLRAQYLRIKRRRGHSKAIVAVAHSILVAAYYILKDEKAYDELGGDYFIRREDQERLTRRLVRQLERLGQRVTRNPRRRQRGERVFLSRTSRLSSGLRTGTTVETSKRCWRNSTPTWSGIPRFWDR